MDKVVLAKDVIDKEIVVLVEKDGASNCTSPAGHCFGSDGGSGIPENLKVAEGRGGEVEVWTLDAKKEVVETKEVYNRCQYCLKLDFAYEKTK